ncbi:MAG: GDSL-type esterase/lipase family protein [Planctomycetota bacterium]
MHEPWYGFTYDTTALGWRVTTPGAGEHVARPAGIRRIVCLGDSCTFGLRVANGDTYAAKLARALGAGYEVWNLGVPGYTSVHGVRQLDYVATLAPDVVVLAFGFNDSYLSQVGAADDFATLDGAPWRWRLRSVLARSQLLRFLYHAVGNAHPRFESVAAGGRWQTRVPPAQYDANMRLLVQRVRALGAKPILIDLDVPNWYVHALIERIALDTSTPLLCTREIFARECGTTGRPQLDPGVAAGRLAIAVAHGSAAPCLVAIPIDRGVLVPQNLLFEHGPEGGWRLEIPAPPAGWEWTIAAKPVKSVRELTQLTNYATFERSEASAAAAGASLHLDELPFAPYQTLLADDPIHPNAAGHQLLARALGALIEAP